ncbi:MAG: hypothetical protein ACE5LF_00020 [Alphaproteobacteria bacterium]
MLGGPGAGALSSHAYLSVTLALVLAAAAAFVLIFLAVAVSDWLLTRKALAGLTELREQHGDGRETDLRGFLAAFGDAEDLVSLASDYVATLHAVNPATTVADARGPFRATVPAAAVFGKEALVDAPLFVWFFRRLPAALSGLGVLGLAFGLFEGLHRLRGDASTAGWNDVALDALVTGAQGGLIALFLAILAAVLIGLVLHAVTTVRYQQTGALCQIVDGLFRSGAEADHLREVVRVTQSESAELRSAVSDVASALTTALGDEHSRLVATVEAQAQVAAEALAKSLRAALSAPMNAVAEAVGQATRDEGDRVQELVQAALNAFIDQLGSQFGNQLAEVNELLKSSRLVAADVQKAFGEMADTLTKELATQADSFAKELRAALDAGRKQQASGNKELATQLKRYATGLSRDVDQHSARFDNLLKGALERVDEITHSAVATSGEDLASTAAAFGGLQTVVESLALSVTPLLNQVVETQERLLSAIDDESAASRLVANAATDMNAAARASRETVERFVVLATRLSETSRAFKDRPAAAARGARREVPAGGRRAPTKELGDALSELREETEGVSKQLPKL